MDEREVKLLYIERHEQLERAKREIERIVGLIRNAASLLRDWEKVEVVGLPLPPNAEVGTYGRWGERIDAQSWPTAADIQTALVAWHVAWVEAARTLGEIAPERRGSLPALPRSPLEGLDGHISPVDSVPSLA